MENGIYIVGVMDKLIKFDTLRLALEFAKKFINDDNTCVLVYEVKDDSALSKGYVDEWRFVPYNSFFDYELSVDEIIYRLIGWKVDGNF